MSRSTWTIATHKTTGVRFYRDRKTLWGRVYHSADFGATWHPTIRAAYEAAVKAGRLNRAPEIRN